MGHTAYQRGSAAIAAHVEAASDEPSGLSRREASRLLTECAKAQDSAEAFQKRTKQLEKEIARARHLIARLRAEKKVLRAELVEKEAETESSRKYTTGIIRRLFLTSKAHHKASLVIRTALSPEQYRLAREQVKRSYGI